VSKQNYQKSRILRWNKNCTQVLWDWHNIAGLEEKVIHKNLRKLLQKAALITVGNNPCAVKTNLVGFKHLYESYQLKYTGEWHATKWNWKSHLDKGFFVYAGKDMMINVGYCEFLKGNPSQCVPFYVVKKNKITFFMGVR